MITEMIVTNKITKCKSMRNCLFSVIVSTVIILTKLIVSNVLNKAKFVFQEHWSVL